LIDDEVVKKHHLSSPGLGGGSAREAAVILKLAGELKPPVSMLLFGDSFEAHHCFTGEDSILG
jgi:nuclear RNA export factor